MSVQNKKEKKNELQEIDIKNRVCYYFGNNFGNILLNKKLYENISVHNFRIKLQQVQTHCILGSIK